MDVGKGVKVHTFLEIDRIEYPYFIGLIDDLSFFITHRLSVLVQLWCASLQHLSAFHKDCTFRIGDDVGTVHLHQIGLDEKARFSRT